MSLFFTEQPLGPTHNNPLQLETPLGNIVLDIRINHSLVGQQHLSGVQSTASGDLLSRWKMDDCMIELVGANFDPILPSGMTVDGCFAWVWRIWVLEDLNLNLSCSLDTTLEASPEPGEDLVVQSFENTLTKLSIGTEDEDALTFRAKNHDWVRGFESRITPDHIDYIDHGITVRFHLLAGNQLQIQFVIAWSSREDRGISTWYAAEQSSEVILNQAGFC